MTENHPNYDAGKEHGEAAGSWVIDGNTTDETARYLLKGIANGDPEVMDMMPHPLSGEWAGESMPELEDRYGIALEDDDDMQLFEEGFGVGYWDTVETAARGVLGL